MLSNKILITFNIRGVLSCQLLQDLAIKCKQCKKHCVPTCKCMLILLDHDSTNNDFLAHEKSLFYNACDCHVRYFYNMFIQ